MKTVKDRSKLAAEKLEQSIKEPKGLHRKVAEILLGSNDYETRATEAAGMFKKFNKLKGPIGPPAEGDWLSEDIFENSEDWNNLEVGNDEHYLNYVMYCRSYAAQRMIRGTKLWYDSVRKEVIGESNALVKMVNELKDRRFEDRSKVALATTRRDEGNSLQDDAEEQVPREHIAETITFHPLWLDESKGKKYDFVDQSRIRAAASSKFEMVMEKVADTLKTPEKKPVPIETLMGLQGTLHHEVCHPALWCPNLTSQHFHLSFFGALKDDDQETAYGWKNMVRDKNLKRPEFYAFLALVIDLAEQKYETLEDGRVVRP
ncbi:hypothetical protein ACHAPT_008522 [Fusarium lateritium]